jgi:hypothetical protein
MGSTSAASAAERKIAVGHDKKRGKLDFLAQDDSESAKCLTVRNEDSRDHLAYSIHREN